MALTISAFSFFYSFDKISLSRLSSGYFELLGCALGPALRGLVGIARGRAWGGFWQVFGLTPPCGEAVGGGGSFDRLRMSGWLQVSALLRMSGRSGPAKGDGLGRFPDLACHFSGVNITEVLQKGWQFGRFLRKGRWALHRWTGWTGLGGGRGRGRRYNWVAHYRLGR